MRWPWGEGEDTRPVFKAWCVTERHIMSLTNLKTLRLKPEVIRKHEVNMA